MKKVSLGVGAIMLFSSLAFATNDWTTPAPPPPPAMAISPRGVVSGTAFTLSVSNTFDNCKNCQIYVNGVAFPAQATAANVLTAAIPAGFTSGVSSVQLYPVHVETASHVASNTLRMYVEPNAITGVTRTSPTEIAVAGGYFRTDAGYESVVYLGPSCDISAMKKLPTTFVSTSKLTAKLTFSNSGQSGDPADVGARMVLVNSPQPAGFVGPTQSACYSFNVAPPISIQSITPTSVGAAQTTSPGFTITAYGQFTPKTYFNISGPGLTSGGGCSPVGTPTATTLQEECFFNSPVAAGTTLTVGICDISLGGPYPFCSAGGASLNVTP